MGYTEYEQHAHRGARGAYGERHRAGVLSAGQVDSHGQRGLDGPSVGYEVSARFDAFIYNSATG